MLIHDHRVVAAELEQALTEPGCDPLCDDATDGRRAGKGDQIDTWVVHQSLGKPVAGRDEQLEHARVAVGLEDAIDDALYRDRAQRRLGRRLPYAHIAAYRREQRIPGPHGDGKVESGDDADHAERMPLLVHAMLR